MIRHCVMFKWKPGTDEATKNTISDGLDQLAKLDMVVAYRHGPDVGLRSDTWDYVVVGDFASADDYRSYAVDPSHTSLIADHIAPNIADRAAVQYEIDA